MVKTAKPQPKKHETRRVAPAVETRQVDVVTVRPWYDNQMWHPVGEIDTMDLPVKDGELIVPAHVRVVPTGFQGPVGLIIEEAQ